jgi:hypothetical protein
MTTDQTTWWDRLYDPANTDTHDQSDLEPQAEDPEERETGQDKVRPAGRPRWLPGRNPRPRRDTSTEDEPDEDLDDEEEDEEPGEDDPRPRRRSRTAHRQHWRAQLRRARRVRWALYNGGAGLVGWGLGLERLDHWTITTCARDTGSPTAAIILGLGLIAAVRYLIDRRTRHWWPPLAWFCRIPLATAVLGLALYTTR